MNEGHSEAPVFIDVSSNLEVSDLAPDMSNVDQRLIISENAKKARVKCEECFWVGESERLVRHVRTVHMGQNPFQCTMCEYSTYNTTRFEEHNNGHKGVKPYKCSYCPYKSVSKKYLKKHELRHRPDNPCKCPQCEYIARTTRSLQTHMSKQHSEHDGLSQNGGKEPCEYCQRSFPESELKRHLEKRKPCTVCMKTLCSQNYNLHMHERHGKPLKKKKQLPNAGTKEKGVNAKFVCALCSWSTYVKAKVLLHLIHHPKQNVDEDIYDVSILRQCGIEVGIDKECLLPTA